MADSLNVIALISGGKDSFFSLLHCMENGHKIVALGNLHPPERFDVQNEDDSDLNSFMYQTVGHTVIPLYEKALDIPLYREPITGTALHTGTSYLENDLGQSYSTDSDILTLKKDETECLVPLLRRIMNEHPDANALCTGAIYSTYQRTRIETVACRLGLISLSYLWQYPLLPLKNSISLIEDMEKAKLDAMIIKVAGSGLDESFLWQKLTSKSTLKRIQKATRRFGVEDDGAILGEGGEFETLVLDGPSYLFKSRIEILDSDKIIIRESGGSAWLKILKANVVSKGKATLDKVIRIPNILEPKFYNIYEIIKDSKTYVINPELYKLEDICNLSRLFKITPKRSKTCSMLRWTISAPPGLKNINEEAKCLIDSISLRLIREKLKPNDVTSSIVLLRSMQNFELMNKLYGTLFSRPNPPARVTISCGDNMPPRVNFIIHLTIFSSYSPMRERSMRRGLHIQSYSYWAPANIGPYSQAIIRSSDDGDSDLCTASISGQIPLIPHTMKLPTLETTTHPVAFQISLSLQHLWRIGIALKVRWWTSVIAYLPHDISSSDNRMPQVAMIALEAWKQSHLYQEKIETEETDESEEPDLWEQKYHAGMQIRAKRTTSLIKVLPDWSLFNYLSGDQRSNSRDPPPFFAVEVGELPRASAIEWHAQLGIIPGSSQIHLSCHEVQDQLNEYAIYQCIFGDNVMQIIVTIKFMEDISHLYACLRQAQSRLGLLSSNDIILEQDIHVASVPLSNESSNITRCGLSYQDVSVSYLPETTHDYTVIPCSRIWDARGQRLSYLWIYNT